MEKQTGFVLVSVLIITTITTMLAFSQINENRLQERIGGNQQKEVNARLVAEKALFAAYQEIKAQVADEIPNSYILDNLKKLEDSKVASGDGYYSFPAGAFTWDGTTFTVLSKGEYFGATAYLKAQIEAVEKNSGSFFNEAVMGCDGVTIGGNGVIDSYTYDADTDTQVFGENASLATLNANADIEFTGAASVKGSVTASGNVKADQNAGTIVTGNITATDDIFLKGVTTGGDIHAGDYLEFSKLSVDPVSSSVTVGGDIKGSVSFNGDTSQVIYGGINAGSFDFGTASTGITPPDIDFGDCDPLAIVDLISTVDSDGNGTIDADELVYIDGIADVMKGIDDEITAEGLAASSPIDTETVYIFSEDSVLADGTPVAGIAASTLDTLGNDIGLGGVNSTSKVLIFAGDLNMTSKDIVIDGDVTLVVMGDITTKNTNFSFANASNPGSLTIITDGKVNVDTGTVLFSDKSVNADGNPPLTIFSSNTDVSEAVKVTSNGTMYAKLYAPLGGLTLGGGGEIMGAVRGKDITLAAGTDIHFDEALQGLNDGGEAEFQPPVYSWVYYHYETD